MAEQQRLLSLVPVGLREAVIDSPPFRASVHHFEDQVEALEKWLESYVKILSDWLSGLQRNVFQGIRLIRRLGGEHHSPMCPSGSWISSGGIDWSVCTKYILTVDPDYTFLAMTRFSEGLKQFWNQIFGQGREIREIMITPMTKFLREDVKEFKVRSTYIELNSRAINESSTEYRTDMRNSSQDMPHNRKPRSLPPFVR